MRTRILGLVSVCALFLTPPAWANDTPPPAAGGQVQVRITGQVDSFLETGETVRPEDRQLSEAMMTYWTNFAKTGDPNGPGVPNWPKYDTTDNALIHLNSPITSGPDTTRDRYLFLLKGIPAMRF